MKTLHWICFLFFSSLSSVQTKNLINIVTNSKKTNTIHRYCASLSSVPYTPVINIFKHSWSNIHYPQTPVNACDINQLIKYLPKALPEKTILVLNDSFCTITEQAWNVEQYYDENMFLMIITDEAEEKHFVLGFNIIQMPVSIPVVAISRKQFIKLQNRLESEPSQIEIAITDDIVVAPKLLPVVLYMFALAFFIFICGNSWAADEFRRKIKKNQLDTQHVEITPESNTSRPETLNTDESGTNEEKSRSVETAESKKVSRKKAKDPAVIKMPCHSIAITLTFAVSWILLIYYFPKVMVHILIGLFCFGALSSTYACLRRLMDFFPALAKFRCPPLTMKKISQRQFGPWRVDSCCVFFIALTLVIVWYIFRNSDWAWILQNILGASICISLLAAYRLGNMRVITLILLGFFIYDIFFVFITPHIPLFQSKASVQSKFDTSSRMMPVLRSSEESVVRLTRRSAETNKVRHLSVMEQVALGLGSGGEVVPLLFVLPVYIPASEMNPCQKFKKTMLGFGDIILPGILLTFCRIFDVAMSNSIPIYYIQSMIAYFIGLGLTNVALLLMNTAQPALLYLVPCILLSTVFTGICRGELKELFMGHRIKSLLQQKNTDQIISLLDKTEQSNGEKPNQSENTVVNIDGQVQDDERIQNE